ncbi:MAG: metallophosphatase family protein [Gemmatimonadetes bacterium]|nr:metallophosphatase family protein [Gemmatimonadota bacterium]
MTARTARALALAFGSALGCLACGPPAAEPLPPNSLAFGVFGDGPYYPWERGRYRRLLEDVGATDIEWLLHVGDLFWYPCSDEEYALRASELAAVPHPVVYTPGDNEWADCHKLRAGRHDPLDRLAALRRAFFSDPTHSTGTPKLALETQAADSAFAEFGENARWRRGGFVFATVHLVGSHNGMKPFEGRTTASDVEGERRMRAGLAWLEQTMDTARATGANGAVIAFHAEIGLDPEYVDARAGYERITARLQHEAATFPGQIILIHGDSHHARVDHPLRDWNGRPYERFTRIETFGSPDIGWLRVVLDTVAGRVVRVETRKLRGWW